MPLIIDVASVPMRLVLRPPSAGPDLCLCCFDSTHNWTRDIQPPAEARDDLVVPPVPANERNDKNRKPQQTNQLANLKLELFVDREHGVVFVLLVTTMLIKQGHELLVSHSSNI